MGYEDREYMRPGFGTGQSPPIFAGAPVTKFLVFSSIAVWLMGVLLTPAGMPSDYPTGLEIWGAFSIEKAIYSVQIWRVITFQFLHADGFHLFSNMLGLFFFAPHVERWMGSRPFAFYYFFCGVAGALFYALLYFLPGFFEGVSALRPMVGASAGIFGILAAFYKIAPDARVLLFFVIPMKMRTLGILFFSFEVLNVVFGWRNAGGSAGHLGGAILGLAFIQYAPLRTWLIKVSAIGEKGKRTGKVKEAKIVRESRKSPIEMSREVDRILEKISAHGIQSLTAKERATLDDARKK